MRRLENTRAEIFFNVDGVEKPAIQGLSDVAPDLAEEKVLAVANLFATISPTTHTLDSTVLITRVRYT